MIHPPTLNDKFKSKMEMDLQFGRYRVFFASNMDELYEVLRLRHQVFFGSDHKSEALDIDPYDMDAEHLMLWDKDLDQLVGTYRMRSSEVVHEFYSQSEFDMTKILSLPDIKVELGRACIHPDYRNGACMALLWQGLAEALRRFNAKWVFGCSSLMGYENAEDRLWLCSFIYQNHLCDQKYRVQPWRELPELNDLSQIIPKTYKLPKLPPLLKAYLNLGAQVCGKPAWDPEFQSIDFLTLLDVNQLSKQVERHFARIKSMV